tara:strand:+ start:3254 stop:3943 length:690 start_codon:yes stop_codon:yes gene_type:complete
MVDKKKPKKLTKKDIQNRQVIWALVLMAGVILIIFLVPYLMKNVINKFEYIGLDFYKAEIEGIKFYSTEIPLINIQGFPIGEYSIYFRNNPFELEDIEVDIIQKKIKFEKTLPVYISIEYDAPICDDNIIAVVGLTNFLDKFGTLEVRGAMNDVLYSNNNELDYVNCDSHPENTVLLMKNGNETKISKTGDNCYELQYKDCEINRITEKFILTIMENYMNRYNELELDN